MTRDLLSWIFTSSHALFLPMTHVRRAAACTRFSHAHWHTFQKTRQGGMLIMAIPRWKNGYRKAVWQGMSVQTTKLVKIRKRGKEFCSIYWMRGSYRIRSSTGSGSSLLFLPSVIHHSFPRVLPWKLLWHPTCAASTVCFSGLKSLQNFTGFRNLTVFRGELNSRRSALALSVTDQISSNFNFDSDCQLSIASSKLD